MRLVLVVAVLGCTSNVNNANQPHELIPCSLTTMQAYGSDAVCERACPEMVAGSGAGCIATSPFQTGAYPCSSTFVFDEQIGCCALHGNGSAVYGFWVCE